MSNYAKIKNFDIANGEGIGVSIFFSGCDLHCKGCFNQELWDFDYGKEFNDQKLNHLMKLCSNEYINHLSILGGEPLSRYNVETTYEVCKKFKKLFPEKKLWLWTGKQLKLGLFIRHKQEELDKYQTNVVDRIVELCDFVIDQPFIEEQKDLTLKWRGSKNQRVIDVQKSIKQGKVVLYED